jgi:hypothetical protein
MEHNMERDGDRPHSSKSTKSDCEFLDCEARHARGPGFVVWLAASRKRSRGFVSWAQPGVIELCAKMPEAWRYGTVTAANDNVRLALGLETEGCPIAIFPAVE